MLYLIKNAVKFIKCFNNAKTNIFSQEIIFKEKILTEAKSKNNNLKNTFSQLFFNDISIFLENNKKENILLFNKVRNDKKHRKRGFQKRGYWKKMHYFTRKNNMMCYAFKVQNINYEKIKKLKRGEIYTN